MQAYEWQCHVCKRSNSAVRDTCTACGFPAAARGEDILLKRALRADATETPPVLAGATLPEPLVDLPLWRKVLGGSGMLVGAAGGLWAKFSWTMQFMEIAFLMMAGGALLAYLCIPRKTAPSPPP
ncbi:hypothetical protein F2P44_25585 [Massilia sp. CCM 8695]|uniref:RanBP2-type domain-containing protein n=1 Tax=Massilia frigida TaxID=2609281 RepID=A0ABX0NIZ7_9BURK|nr:Ran-binding zinc finger domain-containing protein [Massilia frigida]NHZ82625.1 hypothetical protein [Massilia frigida]